VDYCYKSSLFRPPKKFGFVEGHIKTLNQRVKTHLNFLSIEIDKGGRVSMDYPLEMSMLQ
jgi:hypothetical protein